ncbi:hypothetical protein BDQ17DRAFT_1419057 [Cyathus striatus]|nr:hypothetical protein BDQ17DRAFT_1419057 [Cyathus striatus]
MSSNSNGNNGLVPHSDDTNHNSWGIQHPNDTAVQGSLFSSQPPSTPSWGYIPETPMEVDNKNYIKRLSEDVLGDIFMLCIPTKTIPTNDYRFTLKDTPVALGHVCSSWRRIIHSESRFWKTLDLPVSLSVTNHRKDTVKSIKRTSAITRLWFENAKEGPITLRFRVHVQDPGFMERKPTIDEEYVHLARRIVKRYSTRISKLELDVPTPRYLAVFDDTCARNEQNPLYNNTAPTDFTHLESVVIRCEITENPDGWASPDPIKLFHHAPKLRKLVVLANHDNMIANGRIEYPYSQLTHLLLSHGVGLPNFASILSQCTNLKHGYFDLAKPNSLLHNVIPETPGAVHPTVLKHLETLTVVYVNEGNPSVFRNLFFPKLRNLCIDCHNGLNLEGIPPTATEGWDTLFRSPSLRRLHLGHGAVPYTHIVQSLHDADQITELKLELKPSNFQPALFDGLSMSPTAGTPPVLPNLATFRVCFLQRDDDYAIAQGPGAQFWQQIMGPGRPPQPHFHSPGPKLSEMVETRFQGGQGALRKFTMNVEKVKEGPGVIPTRLLLNTQEDLMRCKRQGLKVAYTDHNVSRQWGKSIRDGIRGLFITHWDEGPMLRLVDMDGRYDYSTRWEAKITMHDLN